jgi:hypothetical protein
MHRLLDSAAYSTRTIGTHDAHYNASRLTAQSKYYSSSHMAGTAAAAAAAGLSEYGGSNVQLMGAAADGEEQREVMGLRNELRPIQLWGNEDGNVEGLAEVASRRGWGLGAGLVQGLVGSHTGASCWPGQGEDMEASSLAWFQQELDEVSGKGV